MRPHHRWGQSRPTFAAGRAQNQSGAASSGAASSGQWDTFEKVKGTEEEDNDGSGDTIDPSDLQEYVRDELEVLTTCMDNGEIDATIPGVDASQLESAYLKLKGTASSPCHRSVVLLRVKLDKHLDDNVYPVVRVISDTTMTDQLRSSEGSNDPATTSATQRYGFASKVGQAKSTQRLPCV